MRSRFVVPLLALLSLLLAGTCIAQDAEQIMEFRSDITVHQDASMTVKETIRVLATGDQIKRGIYRDFPTDYKDDKGNRIVVGFDVKGVTKNGQPEPYAVERIGNGKRVRIGDADVFLSPGVYTYTIAYDTSRQLGFFPDHDELYWNVTGNGWPFRIGNAIAQVTLPRQLSADDLKLEAYTGPSGSRAKDYESHVDSAGRAIFVTTKALAAKEGLTIVVGWPKGIVQEPGTSEKAALFLRDNLGYLIGLGGLLAALAYYYFAWNKVGRDPRKGTIIPIYEPPDELSPAALRYLRRMGYDDKAFAAALVNIAVKRCIKISDDKNVYKVSRDAASPDVLSHEEAELYSNLLTKDSITFKDTNHKRISDAIDAVKASLSEKFGSGYFSRNTWYIVPGIVITAATLAVSAMVIPGEDAGLVGFLGVWLAGWTAGTYFLVKQAIREIRGAGSSGKSCLGAGCTSVFALPFLFAEIAVIAVLAVKSPPSFLISALLLGVTNIIFIPLMKAYTRNGRALVDKIEGFRLYMSVAEKDEIEMLNLPEKTPEVFERYLPYAMALDVEDQWSAKFAAVLAAAAMAGAAYIPVWYTGSHFDSNRIGSFTSSIGQSLSGAISSSSTAPGSSSGFSSGGGGGGGSSGGGGGGGW